MSDTKTQKPPNILYIFTDDQSMRTVSCYPEAHSWVSTPNIDRLAAEGVRFTTSYTGAWCAPSRATALSGKMQHSINTLHLPAGYPYYVMDTDATPWWPRIFRQHGWTTGVVGKWHTGPDHCHGKDWDFSVIWDHSQPREYGPYYEPQMISVNGGELEPSPGYSTDVYTDYALQFLDDRTDDPDKPWYLWLCYDAVHEPWKVAERHDEDYAETEDVRTPEDIYPPRPTKPAHMRVYGVWRESDAGEPVAIQGGRTLTDWVQQYNRAVRALDEGVGRVSAKLEEMGQLDNTLVVFTSDQGYAWGQHGLRHKFTPYDASILAPMIMRKPDMIPAGTVCETPVCGQDMAPTFFNIAGLDLPWKMHGYDITELMTKPETKWDRPILIENTRYSFGEYTAVGCGEAENGIPWWVALRIGDFKYARWLVHGEVEELYDLKNDPDELINLALKGEWHEKLAECRQACIDELRRTDAPFVDNMPPVFVTTEEILFRGA